MEWYWAVALLLGVVLSLMAIGLPVAYAFLVANLVGVIVFMGGGPGIEQMIANAADGISSFVLVAVPMFILMGNLFFYTGIGKQVFDALDSLFGRIPGRLSYVTVAGGTLFAALSGSQMANTAMMGSLMIPEMQRRGYKKHISIGPVMGSGGLAILIPPSALAVLLGSLAGIDIASLLIAGVIPGIVLGGLYAFVIFIQIMLDPEAAPSYDAPRVPWGTRLKLVAVNILPMGFVVFCVIGLMLMGVATATESAAFGVLGTLVITVLYRRFSWDLIRKSLEGTVKVTVMVFFIILASKTFSLVFAFSGATSGMIQWATSFNLTPFEMLLIMFGILLVLGCFVDSVSMMLLTIPVFIPLAKSLGFDLVWFGIIMMMAIEMSGTTPPFGSLIFVMLGVAPPGTTYMEVVRAGIPYLTSDAVLVALLIAFPGLALYLPSLLL